MRRKLVWVAVLCPALFLTLTLWSGSTEPTGRPAEDSQPGAGAGHGAGGSAAQSKEELQKQQRQYLKAAETFAREVAGGDNNPQYFQLLENALAVARRTGTGGHRSAMGAGTAHPVVGPRTDITSPFARARAEAQALVRERASIKSDPTWQKNQKKLIQAALTEDPGRIWNGTAAEEGEFPHCVAVGGPGFFCCTGTLIGPNVVVTAAHCVDGGCAGRIYVGLNSNQPDPKKIYKVKKAFRHENYNPFTSANDIGLLILEQNVEGVTPCRIALTEDTDEAYFVRLAGFGITETGTFGEQRKVDVAIASSSCGDEEAQAKYGCHGGKELVAGGNGYDSCNGDSGGPAYVVKGKELFLAGATSRATANSVQNCGDGGVYVRIDKYRDWITKTAQANGGTLP